MIAISPLRMLSLALVVASSLSAYCGGRPDPNAKANLFPIDTSEPRFVKSVKNGHAYTAGPPGAEFRVMHLYGSAYVRVLVFAGREFFVPLACRLCARPAFPSSEQLQPRINPG